MQVDEVLAEIETLSYQARCARLAECRSGGRGPEPADVLDELGRRGPYERAVGLTIAAAARDEASLSYLARAAEDLDADIAARAIGLLIRFGAGDAVVDRLVADGATAVRASVYRAVRRWRRRDLAERLIGPVRERWGDGEAAALLSACGAALVQQRLSDLAYAVPNWATLGRAHPGPVVDHAERELAGLPAGLRGTWWLRHGSGVAAAVPHSPGRVIGLLQSYAGSGPVPVALLGRVGVLIDADPSRMVALLLTPAHRGEIAGLLRRRAVRDRLARLADTGSRTAVHSLLGPLFREDARGLALFLRAFAPGRREAAFEAAMAGVELAAIEFDAGVLEVLPAARREREARRMLGLRRVADDPLRTLEVTAFLPYRSAAGVLGELTRRPDARERSRGYRLLIGCAGRSRDPRVLTEVLESTGRLRNEQDPVRLAAIEAFAGVPRGVLEPVHLPAFAQFVDDALAARDCSYQTRYALVKLATRVFEQGAARGDNELTGFALEVFQTLTGQMGSIYLGRLDRLLRRGQEHELVGALSAQLAGEARRGEYRLVLTLARALGRRGHDVPLLQDALERALGARDDAVIRQAIEYWLAPPRTRGERVARIIALDPSMVTVRPVFETVARDRTDLLEAVLSGVPPVGRFWQEKVRYVPAADRRSMYRWTAGQRSGYLALLHRVVDRRSIPEIERAQALGLAGRVPGVRPADLIGHVRPGERRLRRVALTAAAWTSRPQDVLAEPLALAGTDDAHVAVYAAARAARFTRPAAVGAALGPVLADGKITARKEALRLLVRHRVPGAAEILTAAWDRPAQHRDVRVAIVAAARSFPDQAAARRILTEAADGPRDEARQLLGAAPLLVAPRWREFYANLVERVSHSHDAQVRDAALAGIAHWASWAPAAIPAGLAARIGDLAETAGRRIAVHALVDCVRSGVGQAELRATAMSLAAAPHLPDAEAERDRPAGQRLAALVSAARIAARLDRDGAEPVITALADVLPEPLGAELIAATLRWDDTAEATLTELADRPIGPVLAVADVATALEASLEHTEPGTVHPHAVRLEARGDLTGGLLACALTTSCGPRAGWAPAWRDLLKRLRNHPHPDVAYAAAKTHTAAE